MYWISVTTLGLIHFCFRKGRQRLCPSEFETVVAAASAPETDESQNGEDRAAQEEPEKNLKTETDPWARHLLYSRTIETAYRKRKTDSDAHDTVVTLAQAYLDEFKDLKDAVFSNLGEGPKVIPGVRMFAIVLEEDEAFDRAVEVCRKALDHGMDDGTKAGFAGRIERLNKKME